MRWKDRPHAVLIALLVIQVIAHIDRNMLLGFSPQITQDLALGNAQYGFLVATGEAALVPAAVSLLIELCLFQMVPLGRIGPPEEYASLAGCLASDEHYLVGQVISPNSGIVI